MAKNVKSYQDPTHEEIAACAHRIYESEGRPNGRDLEHWLQAEAQLIAERKAQAGMPIAKPAATGSVTAPASNPAPAANRGRTWPNSPRQPISHN